MPVVSITIFSTSTSTSCTSGGLFSSSDISELALFTCDLSKAFSFSNAAIVFVAFLVNLSTSSFFFEDRNILLLTLTLLQQDCHVLFEVRPTLL